MLTRLAPQPAVEELGEVFPSPFDSRGPVALGRRAAAVMQAELRSGTVAPQIPTATLFAPEGGKMFGVLVVQDAAGEVGFLRSFSGMLAGRWEVAGFVPPLFDPEARTRIEPPGEAIVKGLWARAEALRSSPELAALRAAHESLQSRHRAEQLTLRHEREEKKRIRHAQRNELMTASALTAQEQNAALHALAQESRKDKAALRQLAARQNTELAELAPKRTRLERRLRAEERLRRLVCRALMKQLHDTYRIRNARGEQRTLRELFAPGEPPSGAGDCAAPKLLAYAQAHGLRPLCLAEFWWGAPPAAGGRSSGAFYPACADKCGPLLPYMLEGLPVSPL